MATIKGICRNEVCDMCNQIQEAEKSNFNCKSCGKDLITAGNTSKQKQSTKKLIGNIAGSAALLAFSLIFFNCGDPKVEAITLDKASISFLPGQSEWLNVSVEPKDAKCELIWLSSNENVVRVVDGAVTAKNVGKAIVKVYAKDNGNISATCECIVLQEDVDMETMDIQEEPLILRPGGHQQLTVKATPENQNETISWTSSDESIAKVTHKGKVEAIRIGEVKIIARSDRTGVTDTAAVVVEGAVKMKEEITSEGKLAAASSKTEPSARELPNTKPAVSQQKTSISATSQQKASKPAAPKQKTSIPATSQQKTSISATSQQKTSVPAASRQNTTKPAATQPKAAKPVTTQQTSAQTSKPVTASKSKDFGYATFKGTWPNDVSGRMVFKSSHVIDSRDPKGRVADAGDYVIGEWSEGHLVQGIWYGSDNIVKGSIIIGK